MNAWPLQNIVFFVILIFNVGFTMGIYFNHIRHNRKALERVEENIDKLFSIANNNRDRISRIEGKLNNI